MLDPRIHPRSKKTTTLTRQFDWTSCTIFCDSLACILHCGKQATAVGARNTAFLGMGLLLHGRIAMDSDIARTPGSGESPTCRLITGMPFPLPTPPRGM